MKVAVIYYSLYGHIATVAEKVQEGVKASGVADKVDIFQIAETLSDEILQQMHAPAKRDHPVATPETLKEYDAFLFGIPTRYGTVPAQWSAFWDATGDLWASGALYGKPAGIFVSTGSQGGGQETTVRNSLSYLVHHGLVYVPLGYAKTFEKQANLEEVHGGSPWGAGTFAAVDGSRQPSKFELDVAYSHGELFAQTALKFMKDDKSSGSNKDKSAAAGTTKQQSKEVPATGVAKSATKETKENDKRAKQTVQEESKDTKGGCAKCVIV
ncbi:Piso0_002273 [Millerozyma farinosa CBS 7064]|uniref:Piso0_002273 protein n=1 Tax=Pichia sorbitophila (strain ATCC MYA-4447 / BCRC 22081 / CBS 7064 / NBRC 10061 / NRRL Y-12695) TaxID=559304 RepID=G8YC62_PICSO|nr:Piso0_002273 [Millerozyma farinosa CBS 7064]